MSQKLTNKQIVFVEAYLETLNATEAARRASYKGSNETLRAVGYENLTKPHIQARIRERMNEAAMSAEEVLLRLTRIAKGDFGRGFKITTTEMIRALELLGKRHALFTDRLEIHDWRSKVIDMLRAGKLEPEAVRTELGDELAAELFESAGIRVASR